MAVLKAAYPDYYKAMNESDLNAVVTLWSTMLAEYSYDECLVAVKNVILESPFPPKISDIVTRIGWKPSLELPAKTNKRSTREEFLEARTWKWAHEDLGIYLDPAFVEIVQKHFPDFIPNPEIVYKSFEEVKQSIYA